MNTLRDLFEIRTGYTFRDSTAGLKPGNVAVIQAGDINAARLSGVARIQFDGDKHLLQAGDILLSARGGTVARTVSPDLLPAVAASSVIVLRSKTVSTNTKFVARYLNSQAGQAALSRIMSGSYIKTLRKSELEELIIPTPPMTTQQTIVNLGEIIDEQKQMLKLKEELLTHIYNHAIKQGGEAK